ncbi:MAG: acetoacetate decarboxylase family protein, partial [Caldilineaceae bacterium]|nr:acetoacetate decarboxylase family protein [Caldilineaceae bacterium]
MTPTPEIKFSSPHPKLGTPYNLAPVNYQGAKIYRAYFRTQGDKLTALLPTGIEPLEAGELFFYGADLPMQNSAGVYGDTQEAHRYLEFGLVVPSKVEKPNGSWIEGMYALVLYLDPFAYATPGRERWGWPKKDCVGNIQVDQNGASANLDVSRGGHKLIEVALQYSQPLKQNM